MPSNLRVEGVVRIAHATTTLPFQLGVSFTTESAIAFYSSGAQRYNF
jgi:hypothetical protein